MKIETSVTKSQGKWNVAWKTLSPKTKQYLYRTSSGFDSKKEADDFSKDKDRVEMIKKDFEKTIAEQEDTWSKSNKKEESLSKVVKGLCEEFEGTTLNSTGEVQNPLNGVVEPYPAKRLKDKDFMKVFANKDCECGEGGCECKDATIAEADSQLAAGFDLTDMPLKDWQELFQDLGFDPNSAKRVEKKGKGFGDKEYSSFHWLWQNQGNQIRTSTNPFTGEPANNQGGYSKGAKGYAGYIGIEGNDTDVEHIYKFISQKGDWKDRKFGKANFI